MQASLVAATVGCGAPGTKPDDDLTIDSFGDFGDGSTGGGAGHGGDDAGADDGADDGGDGAGGDDHGDGDGDSGAPDVDTDDDGAPPDDGGGAGEPPAPAHAPDASVSCDDALSFQIQMLDSVVGPCTACASGADHWLAAMIYNPCDTDLEVSLYDGYLIGGMSLVNHTTGEGMGMGSGSTGRVVTEVVAPGDWLSETMYLGVLQDGAYSLSVSFFDETTTTAALDFTVE